MNATELQALLTTLRDTNAALHLSAENLPGLATDVATVLGFDKAWAIRSSVIETQEHTVIVRGHSVLFGMDNVPVVLTFTPITAMIALEVNVAIAAPMSFAGFPWLSWQQFSLQLDIGEHIGGSLQGTLQVEPGGQSFVFAGELQRDVREAADFIAYRWVIQAKNTEGVTLSQILPEAAQAGIPALTLLSTPLSALPTAPLGGMEVVLGKESALRLHTALSWEVMPGVQVSDLGLLLTAQSAAPAQTFSLEVCGNVQRNAAQPVQFLATLEVHDEALEVTFGLQAPADHPLLLGELANGFLPEAAIALLPPAFLNPLQQSSLTEVRVTVNNAARSLAIVASGTALGMPGELWFSTLWFGDERLLSVRLYGDVQRNVRPLADVLRQTLGLPISEDIALPNLEVALSELAFDQLARRFRLRGVVAQQSGLQVEATLDVEWVDGLKVRVGFDASAAPLTLAALTQMLPLALNEVTQVMPAAVGEKIAATALHSLRVSVDTTASALTIEGVADLFGSMPVSLSLAYAPTHGLQFTTVVFAEPLSLSEILAFVGLSVDNALLPSMRFGLDSIAFDQQLQTFSLTGLLEQDNASLRASLEIAWDNAVTVYIALQAGETPLTLADLAHNLPLPQDALQSLLPSSLVEEIAFLSASLRFSGAEERLALAGSMHFLGSTVSASMEIFQSAARTQVAFATTIERIDLSALLDKLGAPALPDNFPHLTFQDMAFAANTATQTLAVQGKSALGNVFKVGNSEFLLRLDIDATLVPTRTPSFTGTFRGELEFAGTLFAATLTLGQESTLTFQQHSSTTAPGLTLSDFLRHLTGNDITLPAEVPEITMQALRGEINLHTGELSCTADTAIAWDVLQNGSPIATNVGVAFGRVLQPDNTFIYRGTLRLSSTQAIEIIDDLHFREIAFTLAFDGQSWDVSGTLEASIFDHDLRLQAGFRSTGTQRTMEFTGAYTSPVALLDFGGVGAFHLNTLRLAVGRDGSTNPLTFEASGALQIDGIFDLGGTLTLNHSTQRSRFDFSPTDAALVSATIPLPEQAAVQLDLGGMTIERVTQGTQTHWSVAASAALTFHGMPQLVSNLLPETIRATFKAEQGTVSLGADRILDGFEWLLPDLEIGDTTVALGTLRLDLSHLTMRLGEQVELSAQIGLGLPQHLNNLFGVREDGTPSVQLFKTYDPADPENSVVRVELSIGSAGIRFTPRSSPLQAIRLVQEGNRSFWYADLGTFGEIKLQVPVLRYDANTSAFAASGSFEVVRPLQLPLTPIKALLRAVELSAAAELLPDALPLAELNIVDAQGNFRTAELVAMVEALTDGRLPDEIGTILNAIGDHLERLPESFRQYLHITIPESFAFAIAVAADGSVRLDAGVQEGDAPLRFLQPRFDVTPLAPFPRLVFDGIELRSLAFGPILGGNLFLLQVDARVDQFDIETLVASLFLPENEAFPLPTSQALQRRLILDKLFMVIVYQTVIPIPVPLFYDQLGIEYLGIEGVGLQAHSAFPMPKVGLSTLTELFANLKQFFTDRAFLLDPQAPPGGTNLVFTLDNNYLQLPEYLGGAVLGQKNDAVVIDAYASMAQLLNALKTLTLNRLIQIVPLEKRLGSARAAFGFLSMEANWLLTTPREFRQGAAQQLNLTPQQQEEFLHILPTLPGSTQNTDRDEEGLIAFLRGQVESPNVAGLEAVFGLAASGPDGFSTGFRLTGNIANVLDLEVAGRVAIPTSSGARELPSPAPQTLQGLAFDGKDDYVRIPQSAHLNVTGALTIAAWVKPQASNGLRNIIAHGHSLTPNGEILFRIANGHYQVGSWNGRDHLTTFPVPAEDIGAWVHLAGSYDGSHWRLYRNGVEVATTPETTGAVPVNADWAFGARSTGSERFFQGSLREVRIWNRALAALEIFDAMRRPLGGNEPGLVGYWPCDEGAGTTVQDRTAHAQHGTVQGPQWTAVPTALETAAWQLVGHSHLNILDRPVFQGDVQIIGTNFRLQGEFDLFPANSPLQASGYLVGEWSATRFYLAGDIQTRLAGLTLAGARAVLSNERVLLQGTWLGASALLDVQVVAAALQVQGRVSLHIALQVDFGAMSRTIGANTVRLTEQFRLDVTVATTLDVTVNENGFVGSVTGRFALNGRNVSVGPLTLTVAPTDIADVAEVLRQRLLAEPLRYFDMLYGDAAAWLAGLRSGALRLAGNASQETGRVLRYAYGLGMTQAATVLRGAGRGAVEVGDALAAGYDQVASVTASALRSAGFAAEDVGRMLQSTYRQGAQEAIATLRNLYNAAELGRVLQRVYGQGAQAAVQILRNVNYPVDQVGRVLQGVYGQGARSAAATLRKAGYTVEEVSDMLQKAYGQSTEAVLGLLRDVGYSAEEAARALRRLGASAEQAASLLKNLWGQGNNEVNRFLKGAGYAASQVDRAVSNAFKDAGRAVRNFFGF